MLTIWIINISFKMESSTSSILKNRDGGVLSVNVFYVFFGISQLLHLLLS